MSLSAGSRLGPHEVLSLLGSGGMGEVYRARDTRLDRIVAIKILPETLATDRQFRERFDREARAISQLDHPNICALYDVGEQDGTAYLVMQYLEGETLETRLKKGALPLEEALAIAIQVASALDRAHRAGIVHRDLKPGNVMLTKGVAGSTRSTQAKLLDFGLAKSTPGVTVSGVSLLPTAPPPSITAQGTILGTFQYMSPEQVEGLDVDARADIFAFGAVFYEVFTGRKAFEGKSQASVMAAILERTPVPMSSLQALLPAALDRVIKKCLVKERDARWQSSADLRDELEWIAEGSASVQPAVTAPTHPMPARSRQSWLLWTIAVALAVALGAVSTAYLRTAPAAITPTIAFEIPSQPPSAATDSGMALSPDGRAITFLDTTQGRVQLFVKSLDRPTARALPGTENASFPFWSPDSRFIGFFADNQLKRVDVAGTSPAQTLATVTGARGGAWGPSDIVFASTSAGLSSVPDTGGATRIVTKLDAPKESGHYHPSFLPDGRHLLFTVVGSAEVAGAHVVSLDGTGKVRVGTADVGPGVGMFRFAAPNHLLFNRNNTLVRQAFDPDRLVTAGAADAVVDQVQSFSTSNGGVLAYRTVGRAADDMRQLTWFDRIGRMLGTVALAELNPQNVSLASDGKQVAIHAGGASSDVWMIDLERNVQTRLTFGKNAQWPMWSPDARSIVFLGRVGKIVLFEKSVNGTSPERELISDMPMAGPSDWSRDGRFVLFRFRSQNSIANAADIWAFPIQDGGKPFVWLETAQSDEFNGQFSPNTRWVAHGSDESGLFQIYVHSFPKPTAKWQVSTAGGVEPRWRGDGKELYFISPDRTLMSVAVTESADGRSLEVGKPMPLFQTSIAFGFTNNAGIQYGVAPDGQRFLVNTSQAASATSINVVVNWPERLKQPAR